MDNSKKFVAIDEARSVLGDGAKEAQAAWEEATGVNTLKANYRREALILEVERETYFDRLEVTVNLNTDIYGNEVYGYYINYASRWSSAEYASELAIVLAAAAAIGRRLEAIGIPYKS